MLVYFRIKTTFLLFEIYNFWFCFSHFWSIISFFWEAHLISLYFCSNFPLITHSILTFFCSALMNRSFYFFQQIFWKEQWLLIIFRSCIWTKTIISEQSCHRFLRSQWCNLSWFFYSFCEFWIWGARFFSWDFLFLFLTLQLSSTIDSGFDVFFF